MLNIILNVESEYRNYIPASIPNLCYHDLYLLHPYIKRKKLNNIDLSISYTTREPRPNEKNG